MTHLEIAIVWQVGVRLLIVPFIIWENRNCRKKQRKLAEEQASFYKSLSI